MEYLVQQRDVVAPGDPIARYVKKDFEVPSPYLYIENETLYAAVAGVVEIRGDKIWFTPLQLYYIPRPGDLVIGLVKDVGTSYWSVDINGPYEAQLPLSETLFRQAHVDSLRKYIDVGEYLLARVIAFDRNRVPLLTLKGKELGKIVEGKVVEVSMVTTIRLLSRRTLLNVLSEETQTKLVLGNNARAWVKGPDSKSEDIAVLTLKMLDARSMQPPKPQELASYIRAQKEGILA
ncbi:MAG: exosome complex protein Rrp4 [Fervidicoccaceae archaeon]